jgi:hypothetical protein
MAQSQDSSDKRNQPRVSIKLRVDAKVLADTQRDDILAGNGYPDLDQESLSLTHPRRGRQACQTFDVSPSGLRLSAAELTGLGHGTSLELDLHLPGERRVVKLLAEVMWAEKGQDSPVVGLRFAALEDEGMRRLRGYLEGLRAA